MVFCWGILWLEAFVLVEGFSFITADVSQFRSLSVVEGQLSILIFYRNTRFLSLETLGQKTIFSFQEATADAGLLLFNFQ